MSAAGLHASAWARIVLDELELDLTPNARHLLETLAHIADEQGEAWPSLARLVHRTGRSRSMIAAARSELVDALLLVPISGQQGGRRRSDGRGVTSRYRLALPLHNRPTGRTVDDVDLVQNRPRIGREPSGRSDAKSQSSPTVGINTRRGPARGAPMVQQE